MYWYCTYVDTKICTLWLRKKSSSITYSSIYNIRRIGTYVFINVPFDRFLEICTVARNFIENARARDGRLNANIDWIATAAT